MAKILVIPDVHLKTTIFDMADTIINNNTIDNIVFLGDLVDEWDQENNIELYKETINRAIKFKQDHPNSLYCWGNHDVGYFADWYCSGNSKLYANEIKVLLNQYERIVKPKYIHIIDNIIFSHAGIEENLAKDIIKCNNITTLNELVDILNNMSLDTMGEIDSPIWLRPEVFIQYYSDYIQIVGHSPVKRPIYEMNTWFLDLFSLASNKSVISNKRYFAVIDTTEYNISFYDADNNLKYVTTVDRSHWNDYNSENKL